MCTTLRPLAAGDVFADFTCGARPGTAEIDAYIHTQAHGDHSAKPSAVWVAVDNSAIAGTQRLTGFFSMSPVLIPISPALATQIPLVRGIGGTAAGAFLAVDRRDEMLVAWYTRLGFGSLDPSPKKRRLVFRL